MPEKSAFSDCFPANLFTNFRSVRDRREWQVLYIRSNCTGKATLMLEGFEVPFYCPYISDQHQWKDRRKVIYSPLFGSYIFVLGTHQERITSLKIRNYVARQIYGPQVGDQDQLSSNLLAIRAMTGSDRAVRKESADQLVGRKVQIVDGPFKGTQGRIAGVKSAWRFVISIDAFSMGASTEILAGEFLYLD